MSHPYYYAVLTVAVLACLVLILGGLTCWTAWRHAVEVRRDATERRDRRDAERAQRELEPRP